MPGLQSQTRTRAGRTAEVEDSGGMLKRRPRTRTRAGNGRGGRHGRDADEAAEGTEGLRLVAGHARFTIPDMGGKTAEVEDTGEMLTRRPRRRRVIQIKTIGKSSRRLDSGKPMSPVLREGDGPEPVSEDILSGRVRSHGPRV